MEYQDPIYQNYNEATEGTDQVNVELGTDNHVDYNGAEANATLSNINFPPPAQDEGESSGREELNMQLSGSSNLSDMYLKMVEPDESLVEPGAPELEWEHEDLQGTANTVFPDDEFDSVDESDDENHNQNNTVNLRSENQHDNLANNDNRISMVVEYVKNEKSLSLKSEKMAKEEKAKKPKNPKQAKKPKEEKKKKEKLKEGQSYGNGGKSSSSAAGGSAKFGCCLIISIGLVGLLAFIALLLAIFLYQGVLDVDCSCKSIAPQTVDTNRLYSNLSTTLTKTLTQDLLKIIELRTNLNCPVGWYVNSNSCYGSASTIPLSFTSAKQKCANHGGHLVSLETLAENNFFTTKILCPRKKFTNDNSTILLGLRAVGNDSIWESGNNVTFSNYATSASLVNSTCFQTDYQGKWSDVSCNKELFFYCEKSILGGDTSC